MQIIKVIKALKSEIKNAKKEAKSTFKYLLKRESPWQFEQIDELVTRIEANYNALINIEDGGDKDILVRDINNCYGLLAEAYEEMYFHYSVFSFLKDITKFEDFEYIDNKKRFFEATSTELKNVHF